MTNWQRLWQIAERLPGDLDAIPEFIRVGPYRTFYGFV
jgi:hypothetical protein